MIRKMRLCDINQSVEIVREHHPGHCEAALSEFMQMFDNSNEYRPTFFVYEKNKIIEGTIGYFPSKLSKNTFFVYWLGVKKSARQTAPTKGIAFELLTFLFEKHLERADLLLMFTAQPRIYRFWGCKTCLPHVDMPNFEKPHALMALSPNFAIRHSEFLRKIPISEDVFA